jgi:hypothetical protein
MALGIELLAGAIIFLLIGDLGLRFVYFKGFIAGMQKEAHEWAQAIEKVSIPNWQSMPLYDPKMDPEKLLEANKVYVAAYGLVLHKIKQEVAENRMQALLKEVEEGKFHVKSEHVKPTP